MLNVNTTMPEPSQGWDEDQQEQSSILNAFLTTFHHFFGDFDALFQSVDDPRRSELIIYPIEELVFAGVLMFLCRLGARRQIGLLFRGNGPSAAKFQALFGTDSCPHGDTLDVTFGRLNPDQVQAIVTKMVRILIRKKVLGSLSSARSLFRHRHRWHRPAHLPRATLGWDLAMAVPTPRRLRWLNLTCRRCWPKPLPIEPMPRRRPLPL